jgi:hypothetical protein
MIARKADDCPSEMPMGPYPGVQQQQQQQYVVSLPSLAMFSYK